MSEMVHMGDDVEDFFFSVVKKRKIANQEMRRVDNEKGGSYSAGCCFRLDSSAEPVVGCR
jgi:hypothetical protein